MHHHKCAGKIHHVGHVERQIQHQAKLSAVFILKHTPECCIFHTHKLRWCYCILNYYWTVSYYIVSDNSGPALNLNWRWSGQTKRWILWMIYYANEGKLKIVIPSLIKTTRRRELAQFSGMLAVVCINWSG